MLNIVENKRNPFNNLRLENYNSINSINTEKNLKIQNNSQVEEYNNTIYYPSSSKEWFSSVYSYNKSYSKSLIVYDLISNKLFSGYFTMFIDKVKILFKRRRDNKSR